MFAEQCCAAGIGMHNNDTHGFDRAHEGDLQVRWDGKTWAIVRLIRWLLE